MRRNKLLNLACKTLQYIRTEEQIRLNKTTQRKLLKRHEGVVSKQAKKKLERLEKENKKLGKENNHHDEEEEEEKEEESEQEEVG